MWLPLLANFNNAAILSWGSACLAWLYRELCRASHAVSEQLSGTYFILQIWAWEHFPIIVIGCSTNLSHTICNIIQRLTTLTQRSCLKQHIMRKYHYMFQRQ
ncbi:Serine/threonine-protein phosphatase 7 long form homolog [Linum perenne]